MAPLNYNSPDFIVGIDFGQTYTGTRSLLSRKCIIARFLIDYIGVVWTNLGNTNPTKSIQDWPGLPPDSVETKVPTRIAYLRESDHGAEPRWGFLCDPDDEYHEITKVHEHFKIYLDKTSLDHAKKEGVRDMPDTVDEAKDLVTDYLRQVHQHVKLSIESITGSWYDKRVEFVFSLPTTWTSLDTANRFNDAIRAAGFTAGNSEKHSAKLELTEAEAAAVFFASNSEVQLDAGDIILICDAGGGTTE
jgi:hypothetical protein